MEDELLTQSGIEGMLDDVCSEDFLAKRGGGAWVCTTACDYGSMRNVASVSLHIFSEFRKIAGTPDLPCNKT